MKALMATDLPAPVAPAMSRWGMRARLATTGLPMTSKPSARLSMDGASWYSALLRMSRRKTVFRTGLGISMPMAALPGMEPTMRTRSTFRTMARSSARVTILLIFTPGAGENS